MTEENRTYITHLKVTDVPWHRLTTAYGRGTDFPAHLTVLEIPGEFQDIAVEFYDLIMENDHLAALLGCRGNYDIAIQIDEVTGTMTGWHWFK